MADRVGEVEIRREYPDNPTPAEIHRRNVNAVRATIFGLHRARKMERAATEETTGTGTSAGQSQGLDVDPFATLERSGLTVPPPFDLLTLAVMPENNTELGPAIDAMAVNVESFGFELVPRVTVDDNTPLEILRVLAEERVRADNFFQNCCEDGETFEDLRDKLRRDLEATGNAYLEYVETPGVGQLTGLNHLPSWTMRLGQRDAEATPYVDLQLEKSVRLVEVAPPEEEGEADEGEDTGELDVERTAQPRVREEVSFALREVVRFKRFRRYAQITDRTYRSPGTVIWFKELGDPRVISSRDGTVVTRERMLEEDLAGEVVPRFTFVNGVVAVRTGTVGFPVAQAANAVRHRRLYCTRSPYGLPRYVGHLFAIFGSRAAEEINFATFKNNNIPSAVITVSNGKLDDESLTRIDEFVEAAIQSDDNYSKFLLLEAEPVMEGMRDPGAMKIEVKPLTREQHTDAMFVTYQEKNDERVRRAWRFPPIFVGVSGDWTGKTIDACRRLAEEQVFGPERQKTDRGYDEDVLLRLGVVWSRFRSRSPNVTENGDLVRMMAAAEKTGALTPRIGRKLLSRVVNEDLGPVSDEVHPDQPVSRTLAARARSTSATDAPGGGEPTSQGRIGLQVGGPGRDRENEPAAEDLVDDNNDNAGER